MSETWRDVVGYEGIYRVSDLGRVRRVKGGTGAKPGAILRPREDGGYLRVMLYSGSARTRKRHSIHILVAVAFLGPVPNGREVNHKDGDKLNPQLDNLEYLTRSQNQLHSLNVLRNQPGHFGSKHRNAILTEANVLEIRELHATGKYYHQELAERFGVKRSVITDIVNHRTWKHVGGPQSPITYRPLKPTRPGNAKLNPETVRQIRSLATSGLGRNELARRFGVSGTLISEVLKRRTWADVD